jgi:hypothetical protein
MLDLKLMALRCIKDASPVHCSRPDIQRIPARCDLEWPQKGPGIFEGRRSWGKELRISRASLAYRRCPPLSCQKLRRS